MNWADIELGLTLDLILKLWFDSDDMVRLDIELWIWMNRLHDNLTGWMRYDFTGYGFKIRTDVLIKKLMH